MPNVSLKRYSGTVRWMGTPECAGAVQQYALHATTQREPSVSFIGELPQSAATLLRPLLLYTGRFIEQTGAVNARRPRLGPGR